LQNPSSSVLNHVLCCWLRSNAHRDHCGHDGQRGPLSPGVLMFAAVAAEKQRWQERQFVAADE
jgi:hypothetical protein